MNKSVIKTGRRNTLRNFYTTSEEDESDSDNPYGRPIRALKRGRGRPPKLSRPGRKVLLHDSESDEDNLTPKLPAKRGRPRLRPLGVQLVDNSVSNEMLEEGLFD